MPFIQVEMPDEISYMKGQPRLDVGVIRADKIIEVVPVAKSWKESYKLGYRSLIVFESCNRSHESKVATEPLEVLQRCLDAGLVS